jgi:hypothetical protein
MPSFALCPTERDGGFDSNRIEVGLFVDETSDAMVMADITIPVGGLANDLSVDEVTSREGNDKGCNSCHFSEGTSGDKLLSEIFPPAAEYLIYRSDGEVSPDEGLEAQTLAEVCACIDQAVAAKVPPLDKPQGKIVAELCNALSKKYPEADEGGAVGEGGASGDSEAVGENPVDGADSVSRRAN